MKITDIKYDDITLAYVVREICNAEQKDRMSAKGEVQTRCPIYPDKWFEVNYKKNIWFCQRGCVDCPAGGKHSPLNFYMLFHPECHSREVAFNEIAEIMSGEKKPIYENTIYGNCEPIKLTQTESPEIRDNTYTAFLNKLSLTKAHKDDLLKRGLSEEDIKLLGFKSLPQTGLNKLASKLLVECHILSGVPGFYFKNHTPQMANMGSGYFIPYRNDLGQIIDLQIRKDIVLTDDMSEDEINSAKKKRYCWFSSAGKDGGCAATNVPYLGIKTASNNGIVYATEGGLKASVAQSLSGKWFVAIPGVNCFTAWEELLGYLSEQNITKIVDAFDMDRFEKPQVNENIKKLMSIAQEKGFEVIPFLWDSQYKGCDDYLLAKKKQRENASKNK